MNKLTKILAGTLIAAVALVPTLAAHAASGNLIANPSVETASGSLPASWSNAKTGNNTTVFSYLNTGHSSNRSLEVQMTKRSGGQAEWQFAPVAVTANTKYTFTDWYQSNVQTHYSVMVTKTGGKTTDFADANLAASTAWKQGTISFTTPKNATSVTIYHYLDKVGQLTTDDFDLEGPAPVAPTVKLSAPKSGATVKGTQTVTATATTTDAAGVASVQFAIDNVNSGTPDTTSPYSFSWDTTKVTNGNHTITATALGKDGLSAAVTETVNVQNPVITLPTITISAPAANAIVSGTQAVTATVTPGSYTVKNVQFLLDGTNLGAADTTSPYSVSWDTKTSTNAGHTLSAVVTTTTTGVTATATNVAVTVNNVTPPPTVSITAPVANATVAGTQTVTATATDSTGIKNVQFELDGTNLGAADTTSPYSVSWDTKTATNAQHTLMAVVTNTAGVTANSTPVSVTVNNPTPPTVNITAPLANATVTGTQAITASAADAKAVTSVQFKLNNVNLGPAITAAPYTYNWDTSTSTNGTYSLTAVATNSSNLTTTSAPVSVTVSNTVVVNPGNGPNIIPNPGLETASGTAPASWLSSNWGTNTSTFTYLNTGHTGTHSVEAQTTAWTNGAANWYYADVPITAGTTYEYTNWYKSNVDTEVDAEVTMTDGSVSYYYLGAVLANTNWTKFMTTFTPPAGAKSMAVYQILAKVGYIISDDYSLNTYTPTPFNRPIVSVTFDDGWANQYQNAEPVIQGLGIPATYYIISNEMTDPDEAGYMTSAQVLSLSTQGNEIASHTVHHCDLTGQQTDDADNCPIPISATQINAEFQNSQLTLQNLIGSPVTDFAYPYGAYNANTISVGSQYYQSQRSVNAGYNTKDNLDLTQLKIYEVDNNITQAQVQAWIDGAIQNKSWLILVYHEVAVTPSDPSDVPYDTQPSDFTAEMNYLKNSGVATETVHQAINEILPQE